MVVTDVRRIATLIVIGLLYSSVIWVGLVLVLMAVLPRRKSDQEISKSDFYQTIFIAKIRPKADPNLLF